jgi:predicted nucleic acid-binding protein
MAMMMEALVDTDVLIDFSRGRSEAIELLRLLEAKCTVRVSDISHMELMVGARDKRELAAIENSLGRFALTPITEDISRRAVDLVRSYRLSHGLLIADALIAATALSWGIVLVTNNLRDFRYIEKLRLFEKET